MKEKVKEYEKLSMDMLDAIEKEDYDKFDLLLNERQRNINEISTNDYNKFQELYKEFNIRYIEFKIKAILEGKIIEVKSEIREYKHQVQGSNSYNDIKRERLNIFSKKV